MEKNFKELTIEDCYGALVNFGADPYIIEEEEQAEGLLEFLTQDGCECKVIEDDDELDVAKERLDLGEWNWVNHVYDCGCWNQEHMVVCFKEEWGMK